MSNNLKTEMLMKMYDDIFLLVMESREELTTREIDRSIYDVVSVEVELSSDGLFSIYEKIYKFFNEIHLEFINKLFSIIDSIPDIDLVSSVTNKHEISVYKTDFSEENFSETSYGKLSRITLLEHIEDIVDILMRKWELKESRKGVDNEWLSEAEMRQLLFLALFHDIGKSPELMKKYEINMSDKQHEERGHIFMEVMVENIVDDSWNKDFQNEMKRLLKNLKKLAEGKISGKETNSTLKRFHLFDKEARMIELGRLTKKEREEDDE